MKNFIDLYDGESLTRRKKKFRTAKACFYSFVFVVLSCCIVMLLSANTSNAASLRNAVIITSGISGCAAIYFFTFVVLYLKRQTEHAERMLKEERTRLDGTITSVGQTDVKIPGSISIRMVKIMTAEGERTLSVNSEAADRLPTDGGGYAFYTVGSYIVSIGRENEDD